MADTLYIISILALPVLLAITFHEAAHGWMAHRLGDDTAYRLGRVTFNPFRHIDPVGTIVLPALLLLVKAPFVFGYAKPVPVDFRRLNAPRRDMVWVALAGPGANLILATLSAAALHAVGFFPDAVGRWLQANLVVSIQINVILAVFNMLPLPPLDGGRVAVGLLPRGLAMPLARLERYGILILLALLILPSMLARPLGMDISIFRWLILPVAEWIVALIELVTGHI